jgi:hypothetical protein
MPEVLYVNNDTGESVDDYGNHYPPRPATNPNPSSPASIHPTTPPTGSRSPQAIDDAKPLSQRFILVH